MNPFIDAILLVAVASERIHWPRIVACLFCVACWVGFFLALRQAV